MRMFATIGIRFINFRVRATLSLFLFAVLNSPIAAVASETKIIVSPLVRAEISGATDFQVRIAWQTSVRPDAVMIVTGLPKSVTFSAGSGTGGLWEVPLADLEKLRIVVPSVEPKRANLSLYLVTKRQNGVVILASARSVLLLETPTETALADTKKLNEPTKLEQAAPKGDERLADKTDLAVPSAKRLMNENLSGSARESIARSEAAAKKPGNEHLAERKADQAKKAVEAARIQATAKQAETDRLAAEAVRDEQARKAEEARAEEARRQAAAKQAETDRLAAEAVRIEQARKAEEVRAEEARRQATAKQAEIDRLAAEAMRVEQARKAEESRAEEARRQATAKQVETDRLAAEAMRVEQARKAEESRAEEARRQATAKQVETDRLAAEAMRVEQARKDEESRADEARRQAAAKQAETDRMAEIAEKEKKGRVRRRRGSQLLARRMLTQRTQRPTRMRPMSKWTGS